MNLQQAKERLKKKRPGEVATDVIRDDELMEAIRDKQSACKQVADGKVLIADNVSEGHARLWSV